MSSKIWVNAEEVAAFQTWHPNVKVPTGVEKNVTLQVDNLGVRSAVRCALEDVIKAVKLKTGTYFTEEETATSLNGLKKACNNTKCDFDFFPVSHSPELADILHRSFTTTINSEAEIITVQLLNNPKGAKIIKLQTRLAELNALQTRMTKLLGAGTCHYLYEANKTMKQLV